MKVGARPILVSLLMLLAFALWPRLAAAQITYAYDEDSRVCAVGNGASSGATVSAYQYDADGNLSGIATNPGPGAIQFEVNPTSGAPGDNVILCGIGFGSTPQTNAVSFIDSNNNSTAATVVSASPTQLVVTIPGVSPGNYTIGETGAGGGAFSIGPFTVN